MKWEFSVETKKGVSKKRGPQKGSSRREFLKTAATVGAGTAVGAPAVASAMDFDFETFMQKNFRELSDEELQGVLERLERKYSDKYGKDVSMSAIGPMDGVLYGYGLDISRCIGCRKCVSACVDENNQSRDPEIQWIRVLEFERSEALRAINLEEGNPYYEHKEVPRGRARSTSRSPASTARIRRVPRSAQPGRPGKNPMGLS